MTHYLKDEDDEGNMLKKGDGSKIETKSAATRKKRVNIIDESHVLYPTCNFRLLNTKSCEM